MSKHVKIELLPLGETLSVETGTLLQDVLFAKGVEFPCGGRGICKGCKIRVLEGTLPLSADEEENLSATELKEGWRLACRARAEGPLKLELAQWEAPILTDDSVFAFTPATGWGVAVDLGTTTLAAQLLELCTGRVLAVGTALNSQAQHGADIMSRVEFAATPGGQATLQRLVREQVGGLVSELFGSASKKQNVQPLRNIVLVGNTVMHHLFCGISVEPLSHVPFEPISPGLTEFRSTELGWELPGVPTVTFLPCLGGFVGSDILAGIIATRLHESETLNALMDLGTNGEIVVGNRTRLLCASTAAGPAFEGARISMGMRAATGAISEVKIKEGGLHCHVLGNGPARGICGSGLVAAVAAGLDLGWVQPNGRLGCGETLPLLEPVSLTQWDIRELQLAKGAIAAGLQLLLEKMGATSDQLGKVYLAGAFGNYIDQGSARRVGLLKLPAEKICPSGNTALLGAKMALFNSPAENAYSSILSRTAHLPLNEDARFQEQFVSDMSFPTA